MEEISNNSIQYNLECLDKYIEIRKKVILYPFLFYTEVIDNNGDNHTYTNVFSFVYKILLILYNMLKNISNDNNDIKKRLDVLEAENKYLKNKLYYFVT